MIASVHPVQKRVGLHVVAALVGLVVTAGCTARSAHHSPTPSVLLTASSTSGHSITADCQGYAAARTVSLGRIDGRMVGNPYPVRTTLRAGEVLRVSVTGGGTQTIAFPPASGSPTPALTSPTLDKLCETSGDDPIAYFRASELGTQRVVAWPSVCRCAMTGFNAVINVVR